MIKSETVRKRFAKILTSNIRNILQKYDEETAVVRHWDYIEVRSKNEANREELIALLQRIPGIHHFLEVEEKPFTDLHHIFELTLADVAAQLENKTFCVRVKRKGKHDFSSIEAERYIGGGLNQHIESAKVRLKNPDVTEICINRPGEVFLETSQGWKKVEVNTLNFDRARQFCTAVVNESNTGQRITEAEPMVSLTFPTGQRAQFVIPPACDAGKASITIRLPSKHTKSLSQYSKDGFFSQIIELNGELSPQDKELVELKNNRNYEEFFKKAVEYKKNIVVSGATGSGKTTFMKALVNHIPLSERLISIEDARELFIPHENVVHLLYSKGGQGSSNITAKSCMESCLRMKPDRIILAELRGDESFYFIRNCASGHPGSITSCHAGSTEQTWDQLALMVKASPEGSGLEFEVIKNLLRQTIDIVVHIKAHAGQRYITGIDFNPIKT